MQRNSFFRKNTDIIIFAFIIGVALAAGVTTLATSIGTNVSVSGTLTTTGVTTLAATTLTYASTTSVSISTLTSGRVPYSTTGGFLIDDADLTFDGSILTASYASTTAFSTSGTASTTKLVVGSGTSLNRVVADYCSFDSATIAASTTGYVVCTAATSGLISGTGDRVLVMATSSLFDNFIIRAASSTAANTISVELMNVGSILATGTTTNSVNTGRNSLNFWAFR